MSESVSENPLEHLRLGEVHAPKLPIGRKKPGFEQLTHGVPGLPSSSVVPAAHCLAAFVHEPEDMGGK